ncbi:hypothetical protein [Christiangramia echinicola]|uniref:Uncharacterized protein n=1 Tax=Christiangramia echinicola TaxID=279359 RepID=A0A1H1P2M3_9FLAO|nr:hypothetical protein [Christiangramia echinicola]SDS05516.1 hypothetical protein SAMN04488552_1957 [Christiangramia echinicola]
MKTIKYIFIAMFSLTLATSCTDDDNDELTGDAIEGGLVNLDAAAIGYVVGNDGTYTASGEFYQGEEKTVSVDVYKSFTDSETGTTTEEILFEEIDFSDIQQGFANDFSFQFKYEDLIEGFSALPSNDAELNIGDFWTLKFVSTLEDGTEVTNASTVKVSVGTRFAGIYRTIEAEYWRIGSFNADASSWPDETVIESVDATTYRVVEYFGLFAGNEWYFQIDENDNITYPEETPSGDAQQGNSQPFITCASGDLTNIPCGSDTNIVIRDDENGRDQLVMSYGYFTAGSGPREFYQVLEKIVQ